MKFLPGAFDFPEYEKVNTYQLLSKAGCPVLKSVLIENNDMLSYKSIAAISKYLGSDYCTLRYQYIKPDKNPVRGGNRIMLDYETIFRRIVDGALLWPMEPLNRLKNLYGINLLFNRRDSILVFECVGRGFDTSNLNRGDVNPHQTIYFNLPIDYGWYGEWWKFAKFEFAPDTDFQKSKLIRLKNLEKLGLDADMSIFSPRYEPLTISIIDKLLKYSEMIYNNFSSDYFVVTSSIVGSKIIFWDISTPLGKLKIYSNNE